MSEKVERFEDLVIWKEGMRLAIEVYSLLKDSRDFGLKDQAQRSAVSIPSNIGEGSSARLIRNLFSSCTLPKVRAENYVRNYTCLWI